MDDSDGINDLLYDCESMKQVQGCFPKARLEKVYDDVHGCRVEVHIPDAKKEEWWDFLIESGWHSASFAFQISLHEDTASIKSAMVRAGLLDG